MNILVVACRIVLLLVAIITIIYIKNIKKLYKENEMLKIVIQMLNKELFGNTVDNIVVGNKKIDLPPLDDLNNKRNK